MKSELFRKLPPGKKCGLPLRGAAGKVWALLLGGLLAGGLARLAIAPPSVAAQDSGAAQAGAQAPITPAVNPAAPNSTPEEPIFPQSTALLPESSRSPAGVANPLGPTGGAGLGYRPIQPGDIVEVNVFESPEYNVRMAVAPTGDIAIPYAGIFHIGGMTSVEAANAIERLFKDREILRNPHVIVTAQQSGYSVSVLGEVHTPGIYVLAGRQRLIDVLTEAGGVTNQAGHLIEVFGPGSMKDPQTLLWDPTLRENNNADVALKPGETVLVSRCGVVYVGGNVGRPGAFQLCESNHTTLSQVIAMAQGIRPSSWAQRTFLLRTSESGTRVAQQIKLDDVLRGKQPDIIMEPDDIVFVPPSSLKAASKTAITAAIGFASAAFLYLH